jgi:hypothetical protein
MGCCCSSTAAAAVMDDDEPPPTTGRAAKRAQKERLHTGLSSDEVFERDTKLKTRRDGKGIRGNSGVVAGVDVEDDDPSLPPACGTFVDDESQQREEEEAATAAAAAAAAAAEAAAAEAAAALAAEEAQRRAAEDARAKAAAEAQAHAAKLNSALATRIACKPSRAQELHTAAALQLSDSAAFDAFVKWEDHVQKAAAALLGSKFAKAKKRPARSRTAAEASLFTLLAMEEQTRNASFVAAMQTRDLSRPLQGKALRCVHGAAPIRPARSLRVVPREMRVARGAATKSHRRHVWQSVRDAVRQCAAQADAAAADDGF